MRVIWCHALLLFLCGSGSSFARACGDCDGNGWVDLLDAQAAAQHGVGTLVLDSPAFVHCNVSGSPGSVAAGGIVDVLDALTLARFAVGISIDLPCDRRVRMP